MLRKSKHYAELHTQQQKTKYNPLNIAKSSSPNILNWQNAKHACLDRKTLIHPQILAEIYDLQNWSVDEVAMKLRIRNLQSSQLLQLQQTNNHKTQA